MKRNTVLEDKRLFVVFAIGAASDAAPLIPVTISMLMPEQFVSELGYDETEFLST